MSQGASTIHSHKLSMRCRRNLRGVSAVLGACCVAVLWAHSAIAATPAHIQFVPNWDGETDSVSVTSTPPRAGRIVVTVVAANGHVIHTIGDVHVSANTPYTAYWDGRYPNGTIVPAGSYRLVATFTADRGQASVTSTPQPVTIAMTPITIAGNPLGVRVIGASRGVMSRKAGFTETRVRIRMSSAGYLSALIVDAHGRVVRTLAAGSRLAGTGSLSWDTRNGSGVRVPDGRYTMMIAATTGQQSTPTQRVPLRVDTAAPSIRRVGSATRTATIRNGRVYVPIKLVSNEAARMEVRGIAGTGYRQRIGAGTTGILVQGSLLGIVQSQTTRSYVVKVYLTDSAGNVRAISTRIKVIGRVAPEPSHPAPPVIGGGGSGWAWPSTGCLSSGFGPRGSSFHYGLDIAAPIGTMVRAATAGTVSFAGTMGGYGNLVIIEHPGGISTRYGHLSRIDVSVGEMLARSQQVGLVGSTGHSTGPHLHFETRVEDVARDPQIVLPRPLLPSC